MHILLVQPAQMRDSRKGKARRRGLLPGLTLPYLAALVPQDVQVSIVDESVEDIDFSEEFDLVGITTMTPQAVRAYAIADRFRARKVPVVMGGFHVTALPDEAAEHCDAIVIGEADTIWPALIEDCRAGRLQERYEASERPCIERLPSPRFDLLKRDRYVIPHLPLQTTRGCPHACAYCAVTRFYGRSYRHRPVEQVVRDVVDLGAKRIFFVDDNVALDRRYAKELFEALIPYRRPWVGQANVSVADDEELLALAARSGCRSLYMGVESVSQGTLDCVGKGFNRVEDYERALGTIRRAGIAPLTSIVFGFDTDGPEVFAETVDFLRACAVPLAFFYILLPLPGTAVFDDLDKAGRLVTKDWSRYTPANVVFKPEGMSGEDLRQGFLAANRKFYGLPSISGRYFLSRQPNFFRMFGLNLLIYWLVHWHGLGEGHPLGF